MKINSNSIRLIQLQLQIDGIKLSKIGFVQISFDSIRKFAMQLIPKVKHNSKNSIKNQFEIRSIGFDSTSMSLELNWYIFDQILKKPKCV